MRGELLGVPATFVAEGQLVIVESAGEFGLFELAGDVLVGHLMLSRLD